MLLKKIVVAEDDDAIAHMVNMALGDAGFLCLRARDGQEALNLIRTQTPDLVVLDVMMPRMDGLEVASRVKADVVLSKIPILMLTALADVEHKVEGFEAGADDYLGKPFDLRELSARVMALIRSARRERDRNPTTGLPGSTAIEDKIDELLGGDSDDKLVLHVDVVGFSEYADQVGYAAAEQLTKSMGAWLHARLAATEGPSCFVGHLGGADFIAFVDRVRVGDVATDLVRNFGEKCAQWTDGAGAGMTLAIAAAPVVGLGAEQGAELAARLAAAMRSAKSAEGARYVLWQG